MTQNIEEARKLEPCPFCGEQAERVDIDEGENAGGSCICCTVCQASGNIEFGRKENFVSNWNRRSTMKTKSPELWVKITAALRHAASGMADRLQQINAIDRAIAFISDAQAALAEAEERGRIEEQERCAAKEEAFDKIVAARRKHVEAVNAYNARRELATAERMRGSWAIKLDEEYRAMHDAQSDLFATMQAVCDAAITKEPTP